MTEAISMSEASALRDQLYRYAMDMQALIDQHGRLQQRHQAVLQALGRGHLGHDLLITGVRNGETPYFITNESGLITEVNDTTELLLGELPNGLHGLQVLQLAPHYERKRLGLMLAQMAVDPQCEAIKLCEFDLFDGREMDSTSHMAIMIVPDRDFDATHFFWLLKVMPTNELTNSQGTQSGIATLMQFDLLANSRLGLLLTDPHNLIKSVNSAFTDITGYGAADVMGKNPQLFSSGRNGNVFYRNFWSELLANGSWSGEFFNRCANGQIYPEWKTVKVVENCEGLALGFLSVFADSSKAPTNASELSRLAYHDALTGLPNRRLLDDRLTQALSRAQRDSVGLCLMFIDLDRFKPINDQLGHDVGDQVLQQVGQRLVGMVRQGDTVARVGGDEFVILLHRTSDANVVKNLASQLLNKLSTPMKVGEHDLRIGASIGCARFPLDASDLATLVKHADSAMYAAKRLGGNHVCLHHSEAPGDTVTNLALEVWHALEQNQMHLVYQPQVTPAGKLLGCEALLRWTHPTLGDISPGVFIPMAETNGAILMLGEWVLQTACAQLRTWIDQGLPELTLSVNVSARQLADDDFPNSISRALNASGIAATVLELEITESEALQATLDVNQRLQALRAMGVRVAIDDFGTGYSSLSRLQHLPVDRLKIDQSFVHDLGQTPQANAISQCIVNFGLAMKLDVVAEGIETAEQLQTLASQGCQIVQGYLTGRPMKPDAFKAWAQQTRPHP